MLRRVFIVSGFAALSGLAGGCCKHESAGTAKAAAPVAAVPALVFTDSEGHACEPLAVDDRKATVLLFLMHDCPVANATSPSLARVVNAFIPRGVRFYGVYATETADEINKHRREYSLPFPGLTDVKLDLARRTGATRVPEAAVLSPDGELLYRGRIDDRAVSIGVMRPQAQREDLRLALEAVLAGQKPEVKFTEAVGCYLPEQKP